MRIGGRLKAIKDISFDFAKKAPYKKECCDLAIRHLPNGSESNRKFP